MNIYVYVYIYIYIIYTHIGEPVLYMYYNKALYYDTTLYDIRIVCCIIYCIIANYYIIYVLYIVLDIVL